MKTLKILRSNKGSATPLIVAVCLVILLLFVVIAEYARLAITVEGVRDAASQAVIATANDNYDDIYHSAREGYIAGWTPGDDAWEESLDLGDVYAKISQTLGLAEENGSYEKRIDGAVEYSISGLTVDVLNNALASGETEGFVADVGLKLTVPIRFCGKNLTALNIQLQTKAKYVPLF